MAGLIPPHLLEQIRAANDIVDVIGSYIPLKRAGANFRALCPFHREKTPSFNVNPHHQIFKCFGCGKGGDVFTFVKDYESLSFMDSVRRLAERARIPLEFEDNPAARQAREIKEVLWQIHEQITQRWQAALLNEASGQIARDYLKKRAVSDEAVRLFRLGYAPELWDDTVNWAKNKEHDLATMEQAGLIIRKEGTDRYYDRFRGRLIFPICDEQGRVIGFSGRILAGDEKIAKYVNSPETPIFTKGKVFFGLDKSKRALLDAETAVICEGQLDLIACYMAGVQNIVAPQGTALTADHARILKRYVEEVVLCFDADKAGQNATVRALDPLLDAGLAVRVLSIPSGKDPDEFIKENGGEAFQQLLSNADGFFDHYLKLLCSTHDITSDKGRLNVIREFGEALNKTHNAVLIDTYSQKAALRLGVAPESVRAELKKHKVAERRTEQESLEDAHADAEAAAQGGAALEHHSPPTPHELQLLKILLQHEEQVPFCLDHLEPAWISHPVIRRVAEHRFHLAREQMWEKPAAFFSSFSDDPAAQQIISHLLADGHVIAQPEKQAYDVVLRLRNDTLTAEMARLTQRLAHPDTSEGERLEILQRQQAMRSQRQRPLEPLIPPDGQESL